MLDETFIPQFETMSGASIAPVPWGTVEKLYLNTSCPSGPQQGDPACPHPVLGDVRVRQAIALSLDKQTMAHSLLGDQTQPATSVIPVGPYSPDLAGTDYNPDQARQLLDQAGWTVGSDGIRTKDGVRGHLRLASVAGDTFRAQEEQLIQQDLQDVGFEVEIQNLPGSVIANGFLGNSPLALGTFDLGLLSSSYQMDPQAYLVAFFGSAGLPNPQTQIGNNYPRMADPQLDQALAAAGSTLDDQMRIANYTTAAQLITSDAAVIPLYARLDIDARSNSLEGWQPNGSDFLPWNAQNWWLSN
jgi:peptide/nickel transport system substrate-binding protein